MTITRPVRFEQDKHWLKIVDASGAVIATIDRWAWSSNDRTIEDTIECRNFKGTDRGEAVAANALQIAQFEEMVAAINSFEASK